MLVNASSKMSFFINGGVGRTTDVNTEFVIGTLSIPSLITLYILPYFAMYD